MVRLSPLLALPLCFRAARGSLVDDIVNAIENAVDCAGCHALLVPLQGLALLGDAAFDATFIAVCQALKVQDPDVCEGIIKQQGPILAHDLRSISAFGQTATKLCDSVFGLCQPPPINNYIVPFPKPVPSDPKVWTSKGRKPFQVAHFSDVHIDREYAPGSDVNCTKPICCRNYADSAKPPKVPAGPMGEHHCDTTTALAQSMLHAIPADTAFSLFTGDVVEASVWLVNQTGVTNDLQTFDNEMATILGAPVYPAIGNHEVAPINLFPRSTASTPGAAQWVFDTQSKGWTKWIGGAGASQVAHISGSYSIVHPGTDLRIISLNTVYWYKANFWLYDSDTQQSDPNGILAFAVQELQAAEDAGQRAWIIAHIPPGRGDVLHDQSDYFDQIVQRYKNTIAAQFYGHSHQDEFAIAYSNYANRSAETAVSVGFIAPSLTPRSGQPAFKVYDIDPDTYEIMDARVFRSNVDSPTFQSQPTWELYYSARATYGPLVGVQPSEPLGPAFWHRVTEAFARNDTAFQQYRTFLDRGLDEGACDAACKDLTICGLRALRAQDNCIVSKPGLNFRRRDVLAAAHGHPDECEGAGLGSLFSPMPSQMVKTPAQRAELKQVMLEALAREGVQL
ncbi:putative converts sphingomyelin to ceramide [Lyophyllum shimeji]|uniref:Sphingomyelin phosphodiesterase n=1 Tax=Lyophyllum shimeji TaxID=47721 RepID=A0A9P3UR83_LYOSH|nr:putative converts sphingomyelin to ceramide [Lyophyllum shimeji]